MVKGLRKKDNTIITKDEKMKVAVLQSNYIPWKGYFDMINDVDLFIFYDEVQYTKNDWRNRNKIYSKQGLSWISVPVEYTFGQTIIDTKIKTTQNWQLDHWNKLSNAYKKTPYWDMFKDFFYDVYFNKQWENLYELNRYLIKTISKDFLGITTQFADSRDYHSDGQKADKLLSLLHNVGTTEYVSGPAAKDYISDKQFEEIGIKVIWKDYSGYKEYKQVREPFETGVSIVDLLFNTGKNAPIYTFSSNV
mgnify:CR=1 FL=1